MPLYISVKSNESAQLVCVTLYQRTLEALKQGICKQFLKELDDIVSIEITNNKSHITTDAQVDSLQDNQELFVIWKRELIEYHQVILI